MPSLQQQPGQDDQHQQHNQANTEHPPDLGGLDQDKIKGGEGQPDQHAHGQRNALEVIGLVTQGYAVLALKRRGETQPAKPQGQLIGIDAGTNIIQPDM